MLFFYIFLYHEGLISSLLFDSVIIFQMAAEKNMSVQLDLFLVIKSVNSAPYADSLEVSQTVHLKARRLNELWVWMFSALADFPRLCRTDGVRTGGLSRSSRQHSGETAQQ